MYILIFINVCISYETLLANYNIQTVAMVKECSNEKESWQSRIMTAKNLKKVAIKWFRNKQYKKIQDIIRRLTSWKPRHTLKENNIEFNKLLERNKWLDKIRRNK